MIVTRVSSEEEGGHLGKDIGRQVLAQPKALAVAAALLLSSGRRARLASGALFRAGRPAWLDCLSYYSIGSSRRPRRQALGHAAETPHCASTARKSRRPCWCPSRLIFPACSGNRCCPQRGRIDLRVISCRRPASVSSPRPAFLCPTFPYGSAPKTWPPGAYVLRLQEVPMAGARSCRERPGARHPRSFARDGNRCPAGRASRGPPSCLDSAGATECRPAARRAHLGAREVIVIHLLQILRRYGHEFVGIEETQSLLNRWSARTPRWCVRWCPRSSRLPC